MKQEREAYALIILHTIYELKRDKKKLKNFKKRLQNNPKDTDLLEDIAEREEMIDWNEKELRRVIKEKERYSGLVRCLLKNNLSKKILSRLNF